MFFLVIDGRCFAMTALIATALDDGFFKNRRGHLNWCIKRFATISAFAFHLELLKFGHEILSPLDSEKSISPDKIPGCQVRQIPAQNGLCKKSICLNRQKLLARLEPDGHGQHRPTSDWS